MRLPYKNLATPDLPIKPAIVGDIETNTSCVRQRSVGQLLLFNMKVFAAVFALVAVANAGVIPATTLVRTPSHDSAVIQSDRLGGNFAYSSVEGHAYAAVSPVVQNVVSPVGVSYSATPIATPIHLNYQVVAPQYIATAPHLVAPQLIGGAFLTAPSVIAPVAPGVIAPSIPISPSENLVPAAPEAPKEGEVTQVVEQPAVIEPAAPVAETVPAPAAPESTPQADDVVEVESA